MSLNWPFYEKESLLILECPSCSNQRIFQGYREQDRICWRCGCCGAGAILHLAKIQAETAWVSLSKHPLGYHNLEYSPSGSNSLIPH